MNRRDLFSNTVTGASAAISRPLVWAGTPEGRTRVTNVLNHGAIGDGKADDTKALQHALKSVRQGGVVYIPSGQYRVRETLILPSQDNIRITGDGGGASLIIAGAPMQDLLRLDGHFNGGMLDQIGVDANGFASTAIRLQAGVYATLDALQVWNPKDIGIHCGSQKGRSGPECMIRNCRLTGLAQQRPKDPASRLGLLVERWTDGHYSNLIIRGFTETGMQMDAGCASNFLHQVHIYRYPCYQYRNALRLLGHNNFLSQCYFDNFTTIGVEVLADAGVIQNCFFLRNRNAFGDGPGMPGDAIRLGSPDRQISNISLSTNTFVAQPSLDPRHAQSTLKPVHVLNAIAVKSFGHVYDGVLPSETAGSGVVNVPKGEQKVIVAHGLLFRPAAVVLTPVGGFAGASYCVDDIRTSSFSIRLAKPATSALQFCWRADA